jgi:hypothetical protein
VEPLAPNAARLVPEAIPAAGLLDGACLEGGDVVLVAERPDGAAAAARELGQERAGRRLRLLLDHVGHDVGFAHGAQGIVRAQPAPHVVSVAQDEQHRTARQMAGCDPRGHVDRIVQRRGAAVRRTFDRRQERLAGELGRQPEIDLVRERNERDRVLGTEERHERDGGCLQLPERGLAHAVAAVQHQHEVDGGLVRFQELDLLPHAVVAHLEVGGGEAEDRPPAVGDERVDVHHLRVHRESRGRFLRGRGPRRSVRASRALPDHQPAVQGTGARGQAVRGQHLAENLLRRLAAGLVGDRHLRAHEAVAEDDPEPALLQFAQRVGQRPPGERRRLGGG